MDCVLEGARLNRGASMGELLAVLFQVGLKLGQILALKDVPHRPRATIPVHPPKLRKLWRSARLQNEEGYSLCKSC